MNTQQIEAAIWLQVDSAYLYAQAAITRDSGKPASGWVATQIQQSAAHSAKMARVEMGIEPK